MSNDKIDVSQALQDFYLPYAGYVIQTRALPDARDGLKTGARFIVYSQYLKKITYDKPLKKGVATVSAAMSFSSHGDASIYGNAVRLAQKFSLRYPIIETQGNAGSQVKGTDYAASRYLEMRGSQISNEMTSLLSKDTIPNWKMNYTQEEKYPTVLPTKFPFILTNGSTGIGVGCSSSIPQFNLKEVSTALVKLLNNPNIDFDEIYCAPDFATGATIINESVVKESLRNGTGKSVMLRAKIEYDPEAHELNILELPYQVFTKTVIQQIQKGIDSGEISGISEFFDATDMSGARINISLTKAANPSKVSEAIYKKTSAQYFFSINMMALKNGVTPQIFTWKELMETYLDHLKDVMYRGFTFDKDKILNRLNALNVYLIALANIDEVVQIVKTSKNSDDASLKLQKRFSLNHSQAKIILDIKLNRLVNMEKIKIETEKQQLEAELEKLQNILTVKELFNKEVSREIMRVSNAYGDPRRTALANLSFSEEDDSPIEEKKLVINITNFNNLYIFEESSLVVRKRGGAGLKAKLIAGEFIQQTLQLSNSDHLLVFSNLGKAYKLNLSELIPDSKVHITTLLPFVEGEKISLAIQNEKNANDKVIVSITRNGLIKKTKMSEYNFKKSSGIVAIKLRDDDSLCSVFLAEEDDIVLVANNSAYLTMFELNSFGTSGRVTQGVKVMTLKTDEYIAGAAIVGGSDQILTVGGLGTAKRSPISEFSLGSRGNRGVLCHKLSSGEDLAGLVALDDSCTEVIFNSSSSAIKVDTKSLPLIGRATVGVKILKIQDGQKIMGVTI